MLSSPFFVVSRTNNTSRISHGPSGNDGVACEFLYVAVLFSSTRVGGIEFFAIPLADNVPRLCPSMDNK